MKKFIIALLMVTLGIAPAWAISNKKPTTPAKAPVQTNPKKATAPAKTTKQSPPHAKVSAQKPATEPLLPFKAFIVVEAQTGKMLEGENIHLPLPPASITKLMLAAIVMVVTLLVMPSRLARRRL